VVILRELAPKGRLQFIRADLGDAAAVRQDNFKILFKSTVQTAYLCTTSTVQYSHS